VKTEALVDQTTDTQSRAKKKKLRQTAASSKLVSEQVICGDIYLHVSDTKYTYSNNTIILSDNTSTYTRARPYIRSDQIHIHVHYVSMR
jgi:hypothetical protein